MAPGKLVEPIINPIIGYSSLLPIPFNAPQYSFIPGKESRKLSPTERGPFLETEKQLNASLIKEHIKPIALSDFLFARRHTIKSGCKGNPLHDTENGDINLSPKTVAGKKSLNTFGKYENKIFLPVQPYEKTGGTKNHTITKLLSRSANTLTLKAKDNDVFVQPKSIRLSSEPFIQSLIKENKITPSSSDQHHSYYAHNYLNQALNHPYASFNYLFRSSDSLIASSRIKNSPMSDQPIIEHFLELEELADKIKPVNMQDAAAANGLLEEYLRHNIIATEQLEINKNFFTNVFQPTIYCCDEINNKAIRSINSLPTLTRTYNSSSGVVKSIFDQSPFYRAFIREDQKPFFSRSWNREYFNGTNRNDSSMPMLLIPDCYGSDYEFKTFVDPVDHNEATPSFITTKAKKVIFATFGLNLIAFDCNDNLWVYGFGITHAPINIKNLNKRVTPDLFAIIPESKNHIIGLVIPKSKLTGEATENEEHFVFQSSSWVKIPNVSKMTAENITSTIRYIHEEAETRLNTLTEYFPINYTEFTNHNIDTYFVKFPICNFPDEKGNITTSSFPTPGKKPYIVNAKAVDSLTVTKVLNYYATTGVKNKTSSPFCAESQFYKNISVDSVAFSTSTDMIDLSGYFCPSNVLNLPDGKTKYISLSLTPTQVNKNGTPNKSDTKQTELAEIYRTLTGLTFLHPTAVREIHRSIKQAGFTRVKKHLRVLHTSSFMLLNSLYVYFDQAYGKERGADITGLIPTPLIEAKDGKLVPFIIAHNLPRTSIIQRAIEPTDRGSKPIQTLITKEAASSLSFISEHLSCSIPKTFANRLDFSGRKNTIASWTNNTFNYIELADSDSPLNTDEFPFMPAIRKALHHTPMSRGELKLLDKLYKASVLPYYFIGFPAIDKRLEAIDPTKAGLRPSSYIYPEHMLSIALVRSFIDKSVDLSECSTVVLSERNKKKYTNLGVTFYRDADTEQSYVSKAKEQYLNQIVSASDYRAPKQITKVNPNKKDPSYSSLCDLITKGFSLVGDAKKGTISLSKTRSLVRIKDNIEELISLDLPSNTHVQDIRKNIRLAWVSTALIRFFTPIRKPMFFRPPDGCGSLNTSSYEHSTMTGGSYNREEHNFYIQSLSPIRLVSDTDCEYPIHGQPFKIKYNERDENGIAKINEDDITFSQDLIHESYHIKNLFSIEAKDVYTAKKMLQFGLELGFTGEDRSLRASEIKHSKSTSLSNYLSMLAYFHRLSLAHIISRLSDRPDDPKNLRLISPSSNRVPHGTSEPIFSYLSQYGFYRNLSETYRISRSALPAVFRDLRYAVIAMPASGIKEHAYAIQKHGKTYRYVLSNSFISGYRKLCLQNVLTCPYTYAAIAKFSSDIQPIDAYFRLQTWIRAKQPFTNTKFGDSILIAERKEPFARILCPSYDNGNREGLTHLTLSDILYNALRSKTHKYSETLIKEVLL